MSDFMRRMLAGTAVLRAPDDGGAPAADSGTVDAGGDSGATGGTPQAGVTDGTPTPADSLPAADGGATPPAADPSSQQPAVDRAQQRMNQLVAERWAERRRAEAAEQQARLLQEQLNQARQAVQAAPQVDADGNPIAPQVSQQPVRSAPVFSTDEIQRQAQEIANRNAFDAQVAAEVARGQGAYADFNQVASALQQFGELPRTFVEAALATGKGADVIYALGKDSLEASRILTLPPVQQAVALAQLAGSVKAPAAPPVVSNAPAPVTPKVGGGKTTNTPSLEDENMSTADWIALREKQLAAQKGQRARR